jgi:hypothetical protein
VGEGLIDAVPLGRKGIREVLPGGRIEKLGDGFDGLGHNDSGHLGDVKAW